MNNFDGHKFNKVLRCGNCHLYESSISFCYPPRTCEEIVKLTTDHNWEKSSEIMWQKTGKLFFCKVCDIAGFSRNDGDDILPPINKLYTCNEWLMLKANE